KGYSPENKEYNKRSDTRYCHGTEIKKVSHKTSKQYQKLVELGYSNEMGEGYDTDWHCRSDEDLYKKRRNEEIKDKENDHNELMQKLLIVYNTISQNITQEREETPETDDASCGLNDEFNLKKEEEKNTPIRYPTKTTPEGLERKRPERLSTEIRAEKDIKKDKCKSCDTNCAEDNCSNETVVDNDDEKRVEPIERRSLENRKKDQLKSVPVEEEVLLGNYAKMKELDPKEESEDAKVYDSDEIKVDEENDGENNDKKEIIKKKPNRASKEWMEKFEELQGKSKWNKEVKGQPEKELDNIKDMLNIEVVTFKFGDVSECVNIVKAIDTKLVKYLFDPGGRVELNIQSKP
ncbi:6143_t:CDS:2, partial [Gigaspora margarita]